MMPGRCAGWSSGTAATGSGTGSPTRGWTMPRCSRRTFLLGSAVAGAVAALRPAPAPALAVVCANCSTIRQQMMEYAQQVYSIGVQLQQYRTQIQQYMNMVQNTAALPGM